MREKKKEKQNEHSQFRTSEHQLKVKVDGRVRLCFSNAFMDRQICLMFI